MHHIHMVLYKMEFFLCVNLTDFPSNIHLTENFIHLASLLFDLSKDRGAIKGAADHWVPVSTVFSQYLLVFVDDELLIGIALRNKKNKFIEEDVTLVDFFEICIKKCLHSLWDS